MLLTVLLLLSLLTVQCGGCDFDSEGVKNIKTTIDSNPTGFVSNKLLTLLRIYFLVIFVSEVKSILSVVITHSFFLPKCIKTAL